MLLAVATPALAGSAPSILLTSGVVKAVDHAQGVVVLGSGWTLRVRSVIVDGQFRDMSAVRVDDVVFVSGAILESPASLQSAGQRTNP